ERLVARAPGKSETLKRPKADRDVLRLEEELSQRLGTTVRIRAGAKKGSGTPVISYRTLDQLEATLARL
ncbi:MAG: chromosome partitioning protein ParB, partial [Betaproteobacteria bacterium]|nr:chromosome partitioning protein ParB [Betaproteobacteria bacterium]